MDRIARRSASAAVAALIALAPATLAAQSVNDWRLPGATVRPAPPGSQGPVDRDNPVVTTSTDPRPEPTPQPSQSASPQPAASPTTRPAAMPKATPPVQRPAAATGDAPAPSPLPSAAPVPPAATPATIPPVPAAVPAGPALAPAAAPAGWYWPWIAALAGLLAAIFAALWWHRRRQTAPVQLAFEPPVVPPRPAPAARPARAAPPGPAAPAPAPAAPLVPVISLPGGLQIALESRRMSASLMATTLSYTLRLTNTGAEPLSAVAVEGDMISAHASLPPEAQIANDNQRLEPRHTLITLAPGESAEFAGDFRLPLAAVTPIRTGEAAYFVPLARLRVEASTASGSPLVAALTWVVGELPEAPGAGLRPFRLDLGPRVYARVGQRAVERAG